MKKPKYNHSYHSNHGSFCSHFFSVFSLSSVVKISAGIAEMYTIPPFCYVNSMKFDNIRAFDKHLEASAPGQFADVYLIIAKEPYDRTVAAEKAVSALLQGASADLALKTLSGDELTLNDLLDELNTLPFLCDHKVVWVRDADKMKKAIIKALEEYLDNPNRRVKLVMVAESVAANTNFYKKSEKAGVILSVVPLKPWEKEKELHQWVLAEVAKAGKRIEPAAAQLLVKQTGLDQGLLALELEKLFCYSGDSLDITTAAVIALCTCIDVDTIFQLSEAVLRRDPAKSLLIASHLLDNGTALIAILVQLRSQLQTDYQVCSILSRGGTPQDVSAEFRYLVGRILTQHIEMATGYGMERFKRGLIAIDDAERTAKSSVMEPELLLETLLMKLTA